MGDLKLVEERVRALSKEGSADHGWPHTERVYNTAVMIAKKEGADVEATAAAALLHDIAKDDEAHSGRCHAEEGAVRCVPILKDAGYDDAFIQRVQHCIAVHRHSRNKKAETREAEVLQDADRLDALGAIAVARTFVGGAHKRPIHDPSIKPDEKYTGHSKTSINLFYEKLLRLTPDTFHTETARKIAMHRHLFVRQFLDEFLAEWNGKK